MASIILHDVNFAYPNSPIRLFNAVTVSLSEGWTGIIGANGAGKTTILQLACGELDPSGGTIHRPKRVLYCPQRTDHPMPRFEDLLEATDGHTYRLRGQLGIEDDWLERWGTLSHGERKRAQIAVSLFLEPELLAVDEPTNHLDRAAKRMVFEALRRYRGIGLLVSHDRELLDDLCAHSLFVSPPRAQLRGGGYTVAMSELAREDAQTREARTKASKERKRLEREALNRRENLRKAEKRKSLRGADPRDNDARAKAYAARNADKGAGKSLRQIEGRVEQARQGEQTIQVRPPARLGIGIGGSVSHRNVLFSVPEGSLPLGARRRLRIPDLLMQPTDRIALVGPNGAGKSTLIWRLADEIRLADREVILVPQEVSSQEAAGVLVEVKTLAAQQLGDVMQWVSRLGSDPHQLLQSDVPSPGEVRKLMLALRLADHPALIIMDEPTNHMDLPSIECLENALSEFAGGLLLVSHDARFLRKLCTAVWRIGSASGTSETWDLHVSTWDD